MTARSLRIFVSDEQDKRLTNVCTYLFFNLHNESFLNLQMSNFVGGNNDTGEATCVFDDSNRVDLFKSLIHHARASNVRESYSEKSLTIWFLWKKKDKNII